MALLGPGAPPVPVRTLTLKHGRSAIDSDQDWGLVEQAAYGHTDVEIYEDSSFATVLEDEGPAPAAARLTSPSRGA